LIVATGLGFATRRRLHRVRTSLIYTPDYTAAIADLKYKQQQQPFYGPLSGTTRVSRYQKKHSPTHHPDHHPVFISFFHLPRSIASSLFKYVLGNLFAQSVSTADLK